MKRKIYGELLQWKRRDASKCALLIDGARRVGKSWIVEELARNEYQQYLFLTSPRQAKRFDLCSMTI